MFRFGKNWRRYVERYFDEGAVVHATRCLVGLLETEDLSGRSFLDVGCGSGLSSLVAHRLGARRVVSFDADEACVECCRYLRNLEEAGVEWEVLGGSILDATFLERIGTFDVVLAWGVLHHTGDMWTAMANATTLVAPDGLLALAIYNRADAFGIHSDGRIGPSRMWVGIKAAYRRMPSWAQSLVDMAALAGFVGVSLVTFRNPWSRLREYRAQRGMDLRVDIRDWLGGYPYEYASVDEVFRFLRERGFELRNLKCHGGLRCNEFVFRRADRGSPSPSPAEPSQNR